MGMDLGGGEENLERERQAGQEAEGLTFLILWERWVYDFGVWCWKREQER
jgi:hypothetical protein